MQLDGEITKSFYGTIKAQEANLCSSEQTKARKTSIAKEAIAAAIFWGNNREHWIEIGKQQGTEVYNKGQEKAAAFNQKQESIALNKAVSLHHTNLPTKSKKDNTAQSSYPSWENAYTSHQSEVSAIPHPLLPTTNDATYASRTTSSLYKLHPHGSQSEGRKQRKWKRKGNEDHAWKGKRQRILDSLKSKNRRQKKSISSAKKESKKAFELEIQEKTMNLKKIGVASSEVHNISNKYIEKDKLEVLALGHKFVPSPKEDKNTIIKNSMDYFTRSNRLRWIFREEDESKMPEYWIPSTWLPLSYDNHPLIEEELKNLTNNLNKAKGYTYRNMTSAQIKNLKTLLEDKDILVVIADKNLGYVIVNTQWYINACLEHLNSDSYTDVTDSFYKKINNKNTIDKIYSDMNDKVTNAFKELLIISKDEYKWIIQKPKDNKHFTPSPFYITPKIHKPPPIKGRPIVPSMNWVTFHLSEWIANQLNPLVRNICTDVLRDSTELLQNLMEINSNKINTSQYYVISADVEALYPNINPVIGLQVIEEFLNEINWETLEKRKFLLWAIEFVLHHVYIYFNEKVYNQIHGAAMGSPMIPPYANIFMHMIERKIIQKHTESKSILLYKRFIDDVFMIITRQAPLTQIQYELNNACPGIKLTWTQPKNEVDFLDITINLDHIKSTIQTNIFQKPLNRYSYLPYHSFHRPSMKTGFIKGEAIRYARSCSQRKDFNKMCSLLTIRLQRRGYPLQLIKSTLKTVQYSNRTKYLKIKDKSNKLPFLFKILHNTSIPHHFLRMKLNKFSKQINNQIPNLPDSLREKITICYQLPKTLHQKILTARKDRGL